MGYLEGTSVGSVRGRHKAYVYAAGVRHKAYVNAASVYGLPHKARVEVNDRQEKKERAAPSWTCARR